MNDVLTCPVTGNQVVVKKEHSGIDPTATGSSVADRPDFTKGNTNRDWFPNLLNLEILSQNSELINPMGEDFCYADEFCKLDFHALKEDLFSLMKDSQEWWPADYGNYGPFLIRMAWHSAGTYRTIDGRGGTKGGSQRFPPVSSWPDNVNLDKARRLLWPIKKKYGKRISWSDLIVLAGNCAFELMGAKLIGFAAGREDVWEPQDTYWGSERTWLSDEDRYPDESQRYQLEKPLAATQMGLIYVNPEGPDGKPIPLESAKDVRETFARMAMDDQETVALVAGGHTFGKTHGAAPASYLGPPPESAPIEQQNLGWKNSFGKGNAEDTIGSGLEGAWKPHPTTWDMGYFKVLLKYDYELTKSPAGSFIWLAKDVEPEDMVEDAHIPGKFHRPMMSTADLSLKMDPIYRKILEDYQAHPEKFKKAFADAWFKLIHRDMGPTSLYLGPEVPKEKFLWQDPIPERCGYTLSENEIEELKCKINECGLTVSELVSTAWAGAANFRITDKRGGVNGGRLRLSPQVSWEANQPAKLRRVLKKYEKIQANFNHCGKTVSIADLIVLGGAVGIEKAAKKAGSEICVPFIPGRMDATQELTDAEGMKVLEPKYDGFRNYLQKDFKALPEELLVDKAQLLNLTPPEMTVLIGGLRVLGNNYGNSPYGVFTKTPETLTNDFFLNLLDMGTEWKPVHKNIFHGIDKKSGKHKWIATRVDLIFGYNARLRAIAEVYASDDGKCKFLHDFVCAWNKVMNADRFDIHR